MITRKRKVQVLLHLMFQVQKAQVAKQRSKRTPGGVLAEKLGRGVRPTSQNPYPIYDQNLRFSLPYLWPNQKFDTLFMT